MKNITILGIPFHAVNETEALQTIRRFLDGDRNHIIVTPNPEAVMQANRNPAFKEALLAADMRLADGIGIVLAARLLGDALPGRVRGFDISYKLFGAVCTEGRTAYLLGAAPGVAEAAAANMKRQFPGLRVIGYHDGYFDGEEEKIIIENIRTLKPDILLVGIGMPKQEIWAQAHRDLPVGVTLCVGGTIDIMGGKLAPTPAILRRLGLEWLHRLIREPSRFKRMMDLPRFAAAVMKARFK